MRQTVDEILEAERNRERALRQGHLQLWIAVLEAEEEDRRRKVRFVWLGVKVLVGLAATWAVVAMACVL